MEGVVGVRENTVDSRSTALSEERDRARKRDARYKTAAQTRRASDSACVRAATPPHIPTSA